MAEKSNLFILANFIPFNLADMEKVKLHPSALRQDTSLEEGGLIRSQMQLNEKTTSLLYEIQTETLFFHKYSIMPKSLPL